MIFHHLAGDFKQLTNQPRRRNNRGSCIKLETILFEDVRAATGLVELLKQRDNVPLCLQADCGRETPEAAANDGDIHGAKLPSAYTRV